MLSVHYNQDQKFWSGQHLDAADLSNSFGQTLLNHLQGHGNKLFQINHDTGYETSCAELRSKILRIAENLTGQGVQVGEIITVIANDHDDLAALCLGIISSGAVLNPLHVDFTVREISHFLHLTSPKIIICEEYTVEKVKNALKTTNLQAIVYSLVSSSQHDDVKLLAELTAGYEQESHYTLPDVGSDLTSALAMVMCTSGTSGMPKAMSVSHAMALSGMVRKWAPIPDGQVIYSTSPLYWVSTMVMLVKVIINRMVRIITTAPITPELILEILEKHKVADMFTNPPPLLGMAECLRKQSYDLSNWVILETGGAHLHEHVKAALRPYFAGMFISIYAMTDLCAPIAVNIHNVPHSTGQLFPGIRCKIAADDGTALGPMETGEIVVKLLTQIKGYYNDEQATREAFDSDGWFRTGDSGYFNENKDLFLVDRKKDMIKYRGFQVVPNELEDFIDLNVDVEKVVVVGIPDDECMFLPTAVAVRSASNPSITERDISQLIEDNFSETKRLRGGVHFVEKVPQTITGKVQRLLVQKLAIDWYNERSKTEAIDGQKSERVQYMKSHSFLEALNFFQNI